MNPILSFLSEAELRFLIGLSLTFIFSATLKKRSGLVHFACSCLIFYIVFDYLQTAYIFAAVLVNITLLFFAKATEYQLTALNFLILYIFKLKGKQFEPRIAGTCDISGVLMLNTIKMSYLGKEFDRKKHSLSNMLGYILFMPGLILGPTCTFLEYVETPCVESVLFPYQTFGISFVFLMLVKFFENYFSAKTLFAKHNGFLHKLVNIYFYNFGQRCRFYFVWHFSNGCYILQGFTDMLNIDFVKVETSRSIKDLSQGWNIKTNKWLKECYFDKLKGKNVFFASFITFTVSALWHGINPGYLIMFLSFCFSIPVIKGVNKILMKHIPVLFPLLSRVQMLFFVMYFSIPFFLLNVPDLVYVWKSVYFYGHFYCALGILLYFILH